MSAFGDGGQVTLDLQRAWTPAEAVARCPMDWSRGFGPENDPSGAWAAWMDAFQLAVALGLAEVRHGYRVAGGPVEYVAPSQTLAFLNSKRVRQAAFSRHGVGSWAEWRRLPTLSEQAAA